MSKDFIDFDDSDDEDMVVIGGIETKKKRSSNKKQIVLYIADDILISRKGVTENSGDVMDVDENSFSNPFTNVKGEIENIPADNNGISKGFDSQYIFAPNIIPIDSPILHISTTGKVLNACTHPATNQISLDDEDRVLTTKEIILFEQQRQVKKGFPKPQTIGTLFPGRKPVQPTIAVLPQIKEIKDITKEKKFSNCTNR